MRTRLIIGAAVAALATSLPAVASEDATVDALRTYEVTLTNLAATQPISPPVVATHDPSVRFWQAGAPASFELAEIAENGNQVPAFDLLSGLAGVTDVVDVGAPLMLAGTEGDSITITIDGYPGDRLSFAGMLICTNDGFVGADSIRLPGGFDAREGAARAYDSGTEVNTERSEDIVDACNALGPVLIGDDDGNENDAVDADGVITRHRGVVGESDLLVDHNWPAGVVMVTIQRTN